MTSGIVNYIGTLVEDLHGNIIDPIGYQTVLYVTLALYIVSLLVSMFLVQPSEAGEKCDGH